MENEEQAPVANEQETTNVVEETNVVETVETVVEETPKSTIQEAKEEVREVFQKHAIAFKDKYAETGILIYADLHKLLSQAVTLLYQVNG